VAKEEYAKAIEEWSRLISKYPNTEESSLALYRTGVFQSEQLGQLEDALATFRRLTWGSWAQPAKARVVMLSQKSLGVATERTFRTSEVAKIAVTVRNIVAVHGYWARSTERTACAWAGARRELGEVMGMIETRAWRL
jgi:tetratricopeptide (TPR) repeat protein